MKEKVRIHLVTDIHHGPDTAVKKGKAAMRLLDGFVRKCNEMKPDLAVDLGDRISDIDRSTDFRREHEVGQIFADLTIPLRHIIGNHDVANLTVMDNEKALSAHLLSNSLDIGGYHLVFWNANSYTPFPDPCRGALRSDLEWLRNDLENTSLPSVIFTHFPLTIPAMAGNYYFEDAPEYSFDPNAYNLREKLAQWGHVVLCVSGHVHQNTWQSTDDISFFSLQSLTESFCTPFRPAEAWGSLELSDEIAISVSGLQPMTITLPVRERTTQWVAGNFRQRKASLRDATDEKRCDSMSLPVGGIILDLDGVVWRGDELISGSDSFILEMKAAGIPVTFVTNNAGRTRGQYAKKMAGFGIPCAPEEFLTSGYAAARWLAKVAPRSGVKVLGSDALREEILDADITEDDVAPDYLLVSMNESLSLGKLSDGVELLEKGTRLILTNPDALLPSEEGYRAGCGAIKSFFETCSREKGMIIGKPAPFLFFMALERMKTTAETTVMIGDTMETDIEGAFRMGMRALRVKSGNPENAEFSRIPWKTFDRLENAAEFILNHNRQLSRREEDFFAGKEVCPGKKTRMCAETV